MTNGLSLEELMKEGTYPEEYAEGKTGENITWRYIKTGQSLNSRESLMQKASCRI